VPEDIALTGFDDIPLARYMNPPLSSVHVPIFEMGERAARRLIASLGGARASEAGGGVGDAGARHERLPTRLVIRASCGKPPKARSGGR
jgi:LacI family transcriptional regulator